MSIVSEIRALPVGPRVSRSTVSGSRVLERPEELLEQARAHDDGLLSLDEYTAARIAASEVGRGVVMAAAVVDVMRNRGRDLTAIATRGHGYGRQGTRRPVSTALDPGPRHIGVATAVLDGPLRGIARGATHFFAPATQTRLHERWVSGQSHRVHSCDGPSLLEAWAYDYPPLEGRLRCPFNRAVPGPHPLEWVGPIPGVNPNKLLLMRPSHIGDEHRRRYEAARAAITSSDAGMVLALLAGAALS